MLGLHSARKVLDANSTSQWSSLFGIKPTGNSSFLEIKDILDKEKGQYAIEIPNELVDHNIATMASSLVGKFIGPRLIIDIVWTYARKKWYLKSHVEISAMAKGFLSFS